MEISEAVRKMRGYEWEMSSESIARKYRVSVKRVIRFDTNTSPFTPKFNFKGVKLNEYPDPSYTKLRNLLSEYCKVRADGIVIGAGADEILSLTAKVFIEKGDKAVISAPTYSMYRVVVESNGGRAYEVQREDDFSLNENALIRKAEETKGKLVFICNPNNPTGNLSDLKSIERIANEVDACVVVDEAYFEFCGRSCASLLTKYNNIVVVRTFSKAFSLAGARVGYSLSSESIAEAINRARMPNSVSSLSVFLAEQSLKNKKKMERNVAGIVMERERLAEQLKELGFEVFPSDANFLLVRFKNAESVFDRLIRKGIVSRKFTGRLKNCLRFTVRNREENSLLVRELRGVVDE